MKRLICALLGHRWAWLGRGTWTMECDRCGDQFHLPDLRNR